jgi:hypothetical protein
MKSVSISKHRVSLSEIWSFYSACRSSLFAERSAVLATMLDGGKIPEEFLGMSRKEVEECFSQYLDELELLISLDLLASAEATIRSDYYLRAQQRLKDSISLKYREVHKKKNPPKRPDLYKDLLSIWMRFRPELQRVINEFNSAFRFRHWIAHGRYWVFKSGRRYSPEDVYAITEELLKAMSLPF